MLVPLLCCLFIGWAAAKSCPKVVSDISQDYCIAKSQDPDSFYYFLDNNQSCIAQCKNYKEEIYRSCSENEICMPGYVCDKRCGPNDALKSHTCKNSDDCLQYVAETTEVTCDSYCMAENEESCMAYHINTDDYRDTYYSALRFKPSCNNDGTWTAKQCKGGLNGRCLCYDAEGTRLYGDALFRDSENMTCACSRRKADLETTRTTTFHCDSMGNYEPLQCDMISKQCWCADSMTGDLVSAVVPLKAITLLTCFSVEVYGSQYLRQCESKLFAQTVIREKLEKHGVTYLTQDFLLCDNDGAYGSFIIENDNAYCTWRNNSIIGAWQANIQDGYTDLRCNCARDFYKYSVDQTCLSNGNYRPLQHDSSNFYCVDNDGFAKTGILNGLDSTTRDEHCDQFY